MLENYFKIAWRNLAKNKTFSLINIAGLSIGMACTILILLWVYTERSWDKSQKNYDRIYHVMSNRDFNGQIMTGPDLMYPLPEAAMSKFPEVEAAALVSFGEKTLFTTGDKKLNKQTLIVSKDFFNIFSFEFLYGDASGIKEPDAVFLTQSTSIDLFGTDDVVGRHIMINNDRQATVKAVIKDISQNSTLQFEGILPFRPDVQAQSDWVNCGNRVFFKLHESSDTKQLEKKVLQLIQTNTGKDNPTTRGNIILHPMSKWRLFEEFKDGQNTGGRIAYVKLFTWISIIILVIACVNFINLSTARSQKRAKEVGVRKTLGSRRSQLLSQFISESLLLSLFAFLISVVIILLILPSFSSLLNEKIIIPAKDYTIWIFAFLLVIVPGFIAGSYPAFYISGFEPIKILKGTFVGGNTALLPRKVLVTTQFIISIILISATLIIYRQLEHVKNRDLGYNPDNLIMLNSSKETDKNFDAFKNDLLQTGLIASINRTSNEVTTIMGNTAGVSWPNAPGDRNLVLGFFFSDIDFVKTLNAKVIEGHDLKAADSNAVLFNKEAIKIMGIKNPVGKEITWAGRKLRIAGVIDNLVIVSPYETSSPLMVVFEDNWSRNINIRLTKQADVHKALASIENTYKKYSPSYPFEFKFVDTEFNTKFLNEELVGKLAIVFAGIAIFICCLGLFGLIAFSIERRKKEIGIRKVLGASLSGLLLLMSQEFLILIGIAFSIAVPATWWMMSDWLKNYSYRTNINAGIFVIVAIIILLITLVTISLNASKAAFISTIKSLRSE